MTRTFVPPPEGGSYVFDPATGALDLVERGGAEATTADAAAAEAAPAPIDASAATDGVVSEAVPAAGEPAAAPSKKSRKD